MDVNLVILLFICHILGDYYFQNNQLAKDKQSKIHYQFLHYILYFIPYLLLIVFYDHSILLLLLLQLIHAIIDMASFFYKRKKRTKLNEFRSYFIDQVLHFISIILVYLLVYNFAPMNLSIFGEFLQRSLLLLDLNIELLFKVVLSILIIHKPMNIFIAKFLADFTPQLKDELELEDKGAGRYIGTLERSLILIFILIGEYTAIGFILTAKSITRYDRITKDKNFGEYYLLGTLMSFFLIIIYSFIIRY